MRFGTWNVGGLNRSRPLTGVARELERYKLGLWLYRELGGTNWAQ